MTNYRTIYCTILMLAFATGTENRNAAAAAQPAYTVTDLGTLSGGTSQGNGINSSGQVTGWSDGFAFLWTPTTANGVSGTLLDLGTLGGTSSQGNGINSSGHVTGMSYTTGDVYRHAFVYDGTMHDLGTLGGTYSTGTGINDSGQVSGIAFPIENDNVKAFLWTPTTPGGVNGSMQDLGALGGRGSEGFGINANGQVTGTSYAGGDRYRAFLWTPTIPSGAGGTMHDLGTLGGAQSGATAVNASGQVTGRADVTGNIASHAFLWTPTTPNGASGTMLDLGSLGGNYAIGNGINASGQVAGWSHLPGDVDYHAFLYTSVSGMVDLNTLIDPLSGWELLDARALNDIGQITGSGYIGGELHAFLLTPVVPEPSAVALLVVGLPLLLFRCMAQRS